MLAANTGESVPGAGGGGGGGGGVRELPGYHFIPYAEPDGEESRMQPMYEEGDYGYDYASQGDEDSRPEVAATVLGDGTSDDAVTYADLDPGEEQVLREFWLHEFYGTSKFYLWYHPGEWRDQNFTED